MKNHTDYFGEDYPKDFCNTDVVKMESEGCAEEWTVYNNDKHLCELTDEQAAKLFNAWRSGGTVEYVHCKSINIKTGETAYEWRYPQAAKWRESTIYRIKPKSERELFIGKSVDLMTPETERTMEQMFGAQFDAGARYVDETQHFGEEYK